MVTICEYWSRKSKKRQVLLNPSRAKALSDCAIEYYQVSNESAHFDDVPILAGHGSAERCVMGWNYYHFHNGDQFKGMYRDVSQYVVEFVSKMILIRNRQCDRKKSTGSSSLKKRGYKSILLRPQVGPDRDMPSHASSTCMYGGVASPSQCIEIFSRALQIGISESLIWMRFGQ